MQKFDVKGHEPSYLPDGNWELVWSDEFDGTELDRTKWDIRLNFWGKPFPAYTDQGIILDGNSHLELHRTEKDGYYVSPQLQTGSNSFDIPKYGNDERWGDDEFWPLGVLEEPKFVHTYGYYECRCKFQKDPETMWSAFWLQSPSIGTRFEPEWCGIENDIMEHFHHLEASSGNIMGGYSKQCRGEGRKIYNFEETPDGWHYFGLDWQEDKYVFYCDGKEVTRCDKHISRVPQFILLTTEIFGYRFKDPTKIKRIAENGVPFTSSVPPQKIAGEFTDDAFIVDFVRVFDRKK